MDTLQEEIVSKSGKVLKSDDLEVMHAGKLCDFALKTKVKVTLAKKSYDKEYENIPASVLISIENQSSQFDKAFAQIKKSANDIASKHPLWERMGGIVGFSAYQMALLMSYMKTPSRFNTPSSLCVYAGIACINGMPVTLGNLNKIREYYQSIGKDEFLGFNTDLSGRLFVIFDCFLKCKGFFYQYYCVIKERIRTQRINEGKVFRKYAKDDPDMLKKPYKFLVDENGDKYLNMMVGKNNQTLDLYCHANARRRTMRTFLHIFWKEWRELNGLPTRNPYAIDYMGHNQFVTLEQVLEYDLN